MKVGLYNLEPFVRNLALDKIRIYHERKGDIVSGCGPMEAKAFDLIYASSIFDWTPKRYLTLNMIAGGTGIDLTTVLSSEIEAIEPHANYGYTTRGCFRKCPFCVVDKKEVVPTVLAGASPTLKESGGGPVEAGRWCIVER